MFLADSISAISKFSMCTRYAAVGRVQPVLGLFAFTILLGFPPPILAESESVTGSLGAMWVDRFDDPGSSELILTFTDEAGRQIRLDNGTAPMSFVDHPASWPNRTFKVKFDVDRPLDTEASARLSPPGYKGRGVVSIESAGRSSKVNAEVDGSHITGSLEWLTIFCQFADNDDEPIDPDYFEDLYSDPDHGLGAYWEAVSYGRVSVENDVLTDWRELPKPRSAYVFDGFTNSFDLFDDCVATVEDEIDFSNGGTGGYDGVNIVVNGLLDSTAAAMGGFATATVDGITKTWRRTILSPIGKSAATVAHEMGHALGLPHSDNGDQDNTPYDNPWDVMSMTDSYAYAHPEFGPLGKHTNAYHKDVLGWFSDDERLQIDLPGVYEVDLAAMAEPITNAHRKIRIPIYGTPNAYIVEARERVGDLDGHLPGDAVIIYRIEPLRLVSNSYVPSSTIDTDTPPADVGNNEGTMFRVGETFTDEELGLSISVEAKTASGFRIEVDATDTPFSVPCAAQAIELRSQADIDQFQDDYGPCDTVTGRLLIGTENQPKVSIENLLGLGELEFVHGTLLILDTTDLKTLQGLDNLTRAGSGISINGNSDLETLDGLSNLETNPGGLSIAGNPKLTDLSSLGRMGGIQLLAVNNNNQLASLDGLQGIEGVLYDVRIEQNPLLSDCSALRSLFDFADDFESGPGPGPNPKIPDIGGGVDLNTNLPGCNSKDEIAPPPSASSMLSGSWWDPGQGGSGFMIHAVSDELAVAYYYGFDEQGERYWQIGVHEGPIEWNQPLIFESSDVSGGTFESFDPNEVSERLFGQIQIHLNDCNSAGASIEGRFEDEGDFVGKLTILNRLADVSGADCANTAVPVETDALTGSWFDPETRGQGFSVHKVSENRIVVYFYGFDRLGDRLWLIGVRDGNLEYGQEFAMDMYQVSGGTFDFYDPSNIAEEPWGSLQIRFNSCTTGEAELDGLDGNQNMTLELLAGTVGLECDAVSP